MNNKYVSSKKGEMMFVIQASGYSQKAVDVILNEKVSSDDSNGVEQPEKSRKINIMRLSLKSEKPLLFLIEEKIKNMKPISDLFRQQLFS
jgi:hypothetical protein